MRPDDGDAAYLRDMMDAGARVARFIHGLSLEDYAADELRRAGVERQIEIIGEAARHLSDAFRTAHPEIPWRPIIASGTSWPTSMARSNTNSSTAWPPSISRRS